jgi:hypothetical protein
MQPVFEDAVLSRIFIWGSLELDSLMESGLWVTCRWVPDQKVRMWVTWDETWELSNLKVHQHLPSPVPTFFS